MEYEVPKHPGKKRLCLSTYETLNMVRSAWKLNFRISEISTIMSYYLPNQNVKNDTAKMRMQLQIAKMDIRTLEDTDQLRLAAQLQLCSR